MNYMDREFLYIVKDILRLEEFQKLKDVSHHGISRYEHSIRVAYFSYKIAKMLRLDYRETAEAALLHDFFIDDVDMENSIGKLRRHPMCAVNNASKYFNLTDKQIDIISTHMFPVTFTPPRYMESWIVDFVDDCSAVYEKFYSIRRELSTASVFLLVLLINYIKMR